jgi:ABC-type polysaccharide/polyol phosphate transport system ATPase subunit
MTTADPLPSPTAVDAAEVEPKLADELRRVAEDSAAGRSELLGRTEGTLVFSEMPWGSDPGAKTRSVGEAPPERRDGVVRFGPHAGERSLLAIDDIPTDDGLIVHMAVAATQVDDERFQVRLLHSGRDEEEILRYRVDGLTISRELTRPVRHLDDPHLVSIVLYKSVIWVYIDSELVWRRPRRQTQAPTGLVIDLLPAPRQQEVVLGGIEIVTFGDPFTGWRDDESLPVVRQIESAWEDEDVRGLYHLLYAVQDVDISDRERLILDVLERLIDPSGGYQPWIVDALTPHLSETVRREWLSEASTRIPKPVIEVDGLTVTFSKNPSDDRSLMRILRGRPRDRFDVLHDLSFTIYPGDIVGIIGRNGAGKSTLLRTLTGSIPVTAGRAVVRGSQILLRPGAGMREHLTGRENIVSSGIFLGLTLEQIAAIEQHVIDFSELGEAIDRPYKYYSDGMRSRLIFSIATAVSPEILMLDELLGAGDIGFQDKAMARLDRFIEEARVVIVVQHSGHFVRTRCNKALYLSEGNQVFFGDPIIALEHYLNEVH